MNNKLLKERHSIVLNEVEILIIKKFLIITTLRVKDEKMDHNLWYKVLKRDGIIPDNNEIKGIFSGDFYENMNRILACKDKEELLDIANEGENLNLFNYVKDVVFSYFVFAKADRCSEEFIIPDRGWASYMGPIGVRKMNALQTTFMQWGRYEDGIFLQMLSPQDYGVFPIAKNMAIITMSPAYKQFISGTRRIIYPPHAPTLSACLGFGDANTIEPPANRFYNDGSKEYIYKVQQLRKHDIIFLNSLLIDTANQYFGYAKIENVIASLNNKLLFVKE